MPTLLKQLELDELSLVDRPANAKAMVSLFKRDNSQTEDPTVELTKEMKAKLKPYMDEGMSEEEAMKACAADDKKMQQENARMKKALEDNGFVVTAKSIKKAEPVEMIKVEGVEIAKSDIPAPVLEALQKADQERQAVELRKRADEELPNFAQEAAMELLKADLSEEALVALKAADAALKSLTVEKGEAGEQQEFAKASDKLDELVKNYMEEHKLSKSQYAKAYAEVAKTDEGKALINKSYEEK